MIKKRIKIQNVLILMGLLMIIPLLLLITMMKTSLEEPLEENDYITEEVINSPLPVVNTKIVVGYPFDDANVTVGKSYYDYQGEEKDQINSILKHENMYIQNTGIDYVSEKEFNVRSILDGTIIEVEDNTISGKSIKIQHENDLISIYQSLSNVNVKKGEIVTQGKIIGTSGNNELEKDLGNHLHFEIYENGSSVNPEKYLNKELSQKKEN